MFSYAQMAGRIHKEALKKNPRVERDLAAKQKKQLHRRRIRINTGHNIVTAFLEPQYKYPDQFIDAETGLPFPLYQNCVIATYYTVVIEGKKRLFYRKMQTKTEGQDVWTRRALYPSDLWMQAPFAGEHGRNLHLGLKSSRATPEGGVYTVLQGQAENEYLQYASEGTRWAPIGDQQQGFNLEAEEIAEEDVFESYDRWFNENKAELSNFDPELSVDTIIKPQYTKMQVGKDEILSIDPVLHIPVTIYALKALDSLMAEGSPMSAGQDRKQWNVKGVLDSPFYKKYKNQINAALSRLGERPLFSGPSSSPATPIPEGPGGLSLKPAPPELLDEGSDRTLHLIWKGFMGAFRKTRDEHPGSSPAQEIDKNTMPTLSKYLLICCLRGDDVFFDEVAFEKTTAKGRNWAQKHLVPSGLTLEMTVPALTAAYAKAVRSEGPPFAVGLTAKQVKANVAFFKKYAGTFVTHVGTSLNKTAASDLETAGDIRKILLRLKPLLVFKAILIYKTTTAQTLIENPRRVRF